MELICPTCGRQFLGPRKQKNCSRSCAIKASRGVPRPHSQEWEAARLEAIRISAAKRKGVKTGPRPGLKTGPRPGLKTGPRPEAQTAPMREAAAAWRNSNPDAAREIAIKNLPKDVRGEKNGNWKGGRTLKSRGFAVANMSKMKRWRERVLAARGHKCADCGSPGPLEVHHIIPLSTTTAFAFHDANGVPLCIKCHRLTDSHSYKARMRQDHGRPYWIVTFIPHRWQAYDTCGNWMFGEDGSLGILVSEMPNQRHSWLVAVHELVEALLCRHRGISEAAVDAFDLAFAGYGEPGADLRAPYHAEHMAACRIEGMLMTELGVDGQEYEEAIDALEVGKP